MKLNTYLHFNGNCEEALDFYEKALGAKRLMLMRPRTSKARTK